MISSGLAERRFTPGSRLALAGALALGVGACSATNVSDALPTGSAAYDVAAPIETAVAPKFTIGPADVLQISTFNEPGLSFEEVPVDADGGFSFPFIGRVDAAGLTPAELAETIKTNLDRRYTRDAQVTVFVTTAASQVFTVEGDVNKPGSFQYAGPTTLLSAVARAGSPTLTAKLDEVIVFRVIDNQRYGAVFNLADIREGRVPDPAIFPGDTVVVGYSAVKQGWQNFLSLVPLVNVFRRF